MDPLQLYINYVTGLGDDRLLWLTNYLLKKQQFLEEHIHPVQVGDFKEKSTRVIVADFPSNIDLPLQIKEDPKSLPELGSWLEPRPSEVYGRLVFISSTSGIEQQLIEAQFKIAKPGGKTLLADPIILTCPRKAGQAGAHPVKGHISRLPDPDVLGCVAGQTWLNPGLLLRFLDENKHLAYRGYVDRFLRPREQPSLMQHWRDFQVAIDQGNHIMITFYQKTRDSPWLMVILAAEDNCLGVDMNATASPYLQPLLASMKTPSEHFIEALHGMASMRDQRYVATFNPLALVSTYSKTLVAAFASHVELYQRHWNQTYEPYANTSVVYGYAYHRDAVRQLARRYATHLRYIDHTLHSLARLLEYSFNPIADRRELEPLIQDFNYFATEVRAMKLVCDQFLEQQVSKLALQDARMQMQEAKDLKRLSYLAFVFVPLSLTSSFFGMNIKELDSGPTPVWVFVVTALAILLGSVFFVWLSAASILSVIGRGIKMIFAKLWHRLTGSREDSAPVTVAHKPPVPPEPQQYPGVMLEQRRKSKWRFWELKEQQTTQALQPSDTPLPGQSVHQYPMEITYYTPHDVPTIPPRQYSDQPRPISSLPESDYP